MDYSQILIGLTYVIVGGLIGIFGSIVHDLWEEKSEKKELKARIREDLLNIKSTLVTDMITGKVHPQAFFIDV